MERTDLTIDKPVQKVAPWSRIVILVVSLVAAAALSLVLTGSVVPTAAADALVFQSTLLFVVMGSAVLEHKFTRPADSVVNSLMGLVSLMTVYGIAPRVAWLVVFVYCGLVFILSLTCSVVSTSAQVTGWRGAIAEWTYRPSVVFGRARLLYSIVFLFAVFSFYGVQAPRTAALVLFWGLFMALWPLGVPELISSWRPRTRVREAAGRVVRVDAPNLVRVELQPSARWTRESPMIYRSTGGEQFTIIPLYKQDSHGQAIGTGLIAHAADDPSAELQPGLVYPHPKLDLSEAGLTKELGGDDASVLVGFVVEDSRIGAIRFETWRADKCREGLLVWCNIGDRRVFYQIVEGVTKEENLKRDRHGYHVAIAAQLGELSPAQGFIKHPWLPAMNTAVFCEPVEFGNDLGVVKDGDFVFGTIPGTAIQVGGPFTTAMDHHTAVLGVTGSGKANGDVDRHGPSPAFRLFEQLSQRGLDTERHVAKDCRRFRDEPSTSASIDPDQSHAVLAELTRSGSTKGGY